jgi:hypothetical protein
MLDKGRMVMKLGPCQAQREPPRQPLGAVRGSATSRRGWGRLGGRGSGWEGDWGRGRGRAGLGEARQ